MLKGNFVISETYGAPEVQKGDLKKNLVGTNYLSCANKINNLFVQDNNWIRLGEKDNNFISSHYL